GDHHDIVLVDVTPLSLGLETLGGVFTKIIERNTAIPTSRSQVFTTAADNQNQVEILVLQGERPMAADNVKLGSFVLDGIPAAPRGVPQIEVTFNIDTNGILNVSAKDKGTGKEQRITIQSSRLSDEEIEKMKSQAEEHESEDRERIEAAELKNEADGIIYQAEKLIRDHGDKISAEEKGKINTAVEEIKKALESGDLEKMKAAKETLIKEIQEFSERLYSQANASSSAEGEGTQEASGAGETVDAEFSDQGQA
ncbi:MAG: Hsp70 family protein, partial [Aminobacterium colombiense]|nr:Hsp70 family protein [Aminobacterium colombiense]